MTGSKGNIFTAFMVLAILAPVMIVGCVDQDLAPAVTRLHLENASDAPVTFLAVGTSEQELVTAVNRLPEPLEPDTVYSALLTRPGNYWFRAEFEDEGHIIQRVEGPVRVPRGILAWRFTSIDAHPLYGDVKQTAIMD